MPTTTATLVLSNYAGNLALTTLLRTGSLYLALHTAAPDVATGGADNEVAGGGYERQPISFSPPAGRACATSIKAYFSGMPAVSVWGVGVWDAPSEGHLIVASPCALTVDDAHQVRVEAGDYAVQF